MTADGSELLTVVEVAAPLKVPRSAAYNAMHAMKHYRIGKHLRVTRQALTAWLEANAEEGVQTMPARGATWPADVLPFRPRSTPASSQPPIHITQPRKRKAPAAQSLGSPLYFEVATVRTARWAVWTVRDMFHAATAHVGATHERRHTWMWGPWIIGDLIDVYRGPGFKDVLVPEHRRGKP